LRSAWRTRSAHAHAGLGAGERFQHVDAGVDRFIRVAGGQHHAFGHAELHLARRQIGHQHGQLADQLLRLVGRFDAGKDVARLFFADIERQLK